MRKVLAARSKVTRQRKQVIRHSNVELFCCLGQHHSWQQSETPTCGTAQFGLAFHTGHSFPAMLWFGLRLKIRLIPVCNQFPMHHFKHYAHLFDLLSMPHHILLVQVVSSFSKFSTSQEDLVVLVCNCPANMHAGVTSEGMVLTAEVQGQQVRTVLVVRIVLKQ